MKFYIYYICYEYIYEIYKYEYIYIWIHIYIWKLYMPWNALKSLYKYTPRIYPMLYILSNSIKIKKMTFNLQETSSKKKKSGIPKMP